MKKEQTQKIENSILNLIDIDQIWKLSEKHQDIKLADVADLDEQGCIVDKTEDLKLETTSLHSKVVRPSIGLPQIRNENEEILAIEEKIANLRKGCFTLTVPDSHPIQVNALNL